MYKVFINKSVVYFGESQALKGIEPFAVSVDSELITSEVQRIFDSDEAVEYGIQAADPIHAWRRFLKHFALVEAAGGLVQNTAGKLLWIKRNGMWDLPKGKMERGETRAQSALREVQEECGIGHLQIGDALPTTFHYYFRKKPILKPTYWFAMKTEGGQNLVPQQEEGITEVSWKSRLESVACLPLTYPSIASMLRQSGLLEE